MADDPSGPIDPSKFRVGPDLNTRFGPAPPTAEELAAEPILKDIDAAIERADQPKRRKVSHVGAPACFALELACKPINEAFGGFGCYLVGSALERPDWRDVDVRFIMEDAEFAALFPDVNMNAHNWEFDPRWLLLTVSISQHLSKVTGLPIDFQFQPQTHANDRHKGWRHPLGLRFVKPD